MLGISFTLPSNSRDGIQYLPRISPLSSSTHKVRGRPVNRQWKEIQRETLSSQHGVSLGPYWLVSHSLEKASVCENFQGIILYNRFCNVKSLAPIGRSISITKELIACYLQCGVGGPQPLITPLSESSTNYPSIVFNFPHVRHLSLLKTQEIALKQYKEGPEKKKKGQSMSLI